MSTLTLYLGHSGERLSVDPSTTSTLEALKTLVSQRAAIQPRSQILLTSQGKQVRTQTLLTETELFVFDSSRLNSRSSTTSSSSLATSDHDFNPGTAPHSLPDQNDLQAWENLFRLRKSWASTLLSGCSTNARQAEKFQDEQVVIERSLGVAVASLQQHVKSAEQKCFSVESWSEEWLQQQEEHVSSWETDLDGLRSIPARSDFMRFLQPATEDSRRRSQQTQVMTLQGFVDVVGVKKAADEARSLMSEFAQKVVKMRENVGVAGRDGDELLRAVDQVNANSQASNTSEPAQLLEEIEIVANKLSSDLEHVQSLPRTAHSISQVSKMASLHTRNYIPTLNDLCSEMNELVRRAQQNKSNRADTALEHMRTLSTVESVLAELYQDIRALEVPEDASQVFQALTTVSRLPSVYGNLLVESVRRREWVAKMKRDAATLQEEVATYQEEEDKRRKRWIRSVEDVVKAEALHSSVLGIEISLQNEGGSWPLVTRDELQDYLSTLVELFGQCSLTQELEMAVADLDKPTRKQIKHAKAFKNGSMHEAAFGDTSLLLRGDDQHKALRESNTRLEEELKGQKSRVRKLEDLLHRQSRVGRAAAGDMFTPSGASAAERRVTLPTGIPHQAFDDFSHNNSIKTPRGHAPAAEEKRLAARVVDLEAELQTAKDDAVVRHASDFETQRQIEEATSIKRDLMDNMEAQQREFATERRTLEKELAEAKEKVEELDNELERLLGSRDDERSGIDARTLAFDEEVARLKSDISEQAGRAAQERDAAKTLETKLRAAEDARATAEAELIKLRSERDQRSEADAEQVQLLVTAHAYLEPGVDVPSGLTGLSFNLEELSRRSAAHRKDLEEAVALAKSENESLRSSSERLKAELATLAAQRTESEDKVRQTEELLALEEAKAKTTEQQLNDESEQLRTLRAKFTDDEIGSEALRQRVVEGEARAGALARELAEARSHINSLDVELMRLQKKSKQHQDAAEESADRLGIRAEHAKDVSQRLFTQNSRLCRLLERLGLSVSYQGDAMVVERASKIAASTTIVDPESQQNRIASMILPAPSRKSSGVEDIDLSFLQWPDAPTGEDESAQFQAFSQQLSRFNIDTLSEAIVKRVRDFEYTARKYNKEAKESTKRAEAYKERASKLKTEVNTKIAVRDYKEGDLALFLPTRGQAKGAWAAFNIGCPHYFLAEKDGMRLTNREYIVARINKVEQKVVNLSRRLSQPAEGRSPDEANVESRNMDDDDNPFDLSDGLTWWMVHATEERGAGGAPTTPGLGKSTVAAANVDARGSIRIKRNSKGDDASKHLNKSLESRRSSSTSKKSFAGAGVASTAHGVNVSNNAEPVTVSGDGGEHAGGGQALDLPSPTAPTAINAGLGISEAWTDAQPVNDQVRSASTLTQAGLEMLSLTMPQSLKPLPTPVDRSHHPSTTRSRPSSPSKQPSTSALRQERSQSPSKSIRSLHRHLEANPSPAKTSSPVRGITPAKKQQQGQQGGWEKLWTGSLSIEGGSPSKGGKDGKP